MASNNESVAGLSNLENQASLAQKQHKTFTKNFSFCGHLTGSNVARVDVDNNKIIRIRPLHYDEKYNPEDFNAWKLEAQVLQLHISCPLSPKTLT